MNIELETRPVDRKVIDGVYDTKKMLLKLEDHRVTKHFKARSSGTPRRYQIEKEALKRLSNVDGTPTLLDTHDDEHTIEMSRLPGRSATYLSEKNIKDLKLIVDGMLAAGVARHSLPIRDIVVDEDEHVGLVDFERATLRKHRWRPDWLIAKAVVRYNFCRLMYTYQPQLLTPPQMLQIYIGTKLRVLMLLMHSLSH